MLTDFAYALRLLGRSPGFTAAVVLSLGLGIGANTAIFTLMDAVMWRMLPVQDPEHLLVAALQQGTDIGGGFNYDDYKILRDAEHDGAVGRIRDGLRQRERRRPS